MQPGHTFDMAVSPSNRVSRSGGSNRLQQERCVATEGVRVIVLACSAISIPALPLLPLNDRVLQYRWWYQGKVRVHIPLAHGRELPDFLQR